MHSLHAQRKDVVIVHGSPREAPPCRSELGALASAEEGGVILIFKTLVPAVARRGLFQEAACEEVAGPPVYFARATTSQESGESEALPANKKATGKMDGAKRLVPVEPGL